MSSRSIAAAALTFALAVFSAPPVLANSPHFIGDPSCTLSLTSGLTCTGKAAGLGAGPTAAFLTAASISATYKCRNKGQNTAPGQPIVTQDVTGPSQDITPRNGQITFAPNLPLPTPPSAASQCPNPNWTVVLASVIYTNVTLHVQQPPGTDLLTDALGNFSGP